MRWAGEKFAGELGMIFHDMSFCEGAGVSAMTVKDFGGNPFRVLGLNASATQDEIDRAARMVRLAGNQALADYDDRWLGPMDRSAMAVERALMRLTSPTERLEARAWWFGQLPRSEKEALNVLTFDANRD